MLRRLGVVQIVFFGVLIVAVPTAAYHLRSGRYPQAAMAAGATIAGIALAVQWLRRPEYRLKSQPDTLQTVMVPTVVPREAPAVQREQMSGLKLLGSHPPRIGWLRNGLLAGLAATTAMALALAVAWLLAATLGDTTGGMLTAWLWALSHNQPVEMVRATPLLAVALQLAIGLACSLVYAGYFEGLAGGPGWGRGALLSLVLWILSLVLFLPLVGAGLFGLGLQAGPLPALGNLMVHLVYGSTLGAVYAIPEGSGLDASVEDLAASVRADRGAAIGIVVGAIAGAAIGTLVQQFSDSSPLLPSGSLVLGGGFIGGSWGTLLGALAGLGMRREH